MQCAVQGCLNMAGVPGSAKGLCRAHYRRWQRYGTENEPLRRVVSWKGEKCADAGCDKPIMANGLCANHYAVQRRRNDPEGQRRRNQAFKERYRAKQEKLMGRPRPLYCELCNEHANSPFGHNFAGIVYDHDHATGLPRGWLCDRCNKVLGLVKDSAELLTKMANYLQGHGLLGLPKRSA